MLHHSPYARLLGRRQFLLFWNGFVVSALGDAMARTALVWYVYQLTRSPVVVGTFLLAYTGPVILGGLGAGILLDRFDRRRVMIADAIFRAAVTAAVPVLALLGTLRLWQLYGVALIYGLLMMIPLAGIPALLPDIVANEGDLNAANSLETIGYTVAGVLGPAIAGLLIARIGVPLVVGGDALSFCAFALALWQLPVRTAVLAGDGPSGTRKAGLADAVSLLRSNSILLSTTLMFCAFNFGYGILSVWLPVLVSGIPGGGAAMYGAVLAVEAGGEFIGSLLSTGVGQRLTLGTRICLAQTLAGASLLLLLLGTSTALIGLGLFGLGVFSAPLTVWAQTLRMKVIPQELRGRTFALLRTLMQAAGPAASGLAGVGLVALGIVPMMALSVGLIGVPGLVGYRVAELRAATVQRVGA